MAAVLPPAGTRRLATPLATRLAALALALAGAGQPARADTTTERIVADTTAALPACLAWRPSGICFWLVCGLSGCKVVTSLRVSHYRPDAVVSSFHEGGRHPWIDVGRPLASRLRAAARSLVSLPVDSAGTRTREDRRDRNGLFRDADLIGHPGSLAAMLGGSAPMLCASPVQALLPYFHSYLDALAWRALLPVEAWYPASLLPGRREIGHWPRNSWGPVHPRTGAVVQPHPVKGAAVIVQRAGDIATRDGQPHVYRKLPSGGRHLVGGQMVWYPPPLREAAGHTGRWQMLSPVAERSCRVFGADDSLSPASWGDGRGSPAEGYSFNLWRPYSCCERRGTFLGAVTF